MENNNTTNTRQTGNLTASQNFILNAMLMTDGYKLGHKLMYPKNMTKLYSNITPRGNKYLPDAIYGAVVFGIQYYIKKYLIEDFNTNFFNLPEDMVKEQYESLLKSYLGEDMAKMIGTDHIVELHKLGYLPIKIKALPEGSYCPMGVPMMTITNTHPDFAWLTNYLESLTSNVIWHPVTAATIADVFKRELIKHAIKTGFYNDKNINLGFLCHDFSMRGMSSLESSVTCGMAFLTSFNGSECVPAIANINHYYPVGNEIVAATVAASEHSVECTNAFNHECSNTIDINSIVPSKSDSYNSDQPDDELYFIRMLDIFRSGFVSIVSDGFDYWHFLTKIVPKYRSEIMKRDGRVVIRPDSGDPVKIICGDPDAEDPFVRMGSYEFLWNIFGGTFNEKGYKVLDTHIGLLYGDSINMKRQREIYRQLEEKGFAATNLVLGIGSFSMMSCTRDSLSMACKSTYYELDEQVPGKAIYKDPKTVCGTPKKSHKGLLRVDVNSTGTYTVQDNVSVDEENDGILKTVFENGKLIHEYTLTDIRNNRYISVMQKLNSEKV